MNRQTDLQHFELFIDGRHVKPSSGEYSLDIDPATEQRKALRGEVRHLGRFRKPRGKPRLDRVTIGRCDIERRSAVAPDQCLGVTLAAQHLFPRS